jgi:hypothetical protein
MMRPCHKPVAIQQQRTSERRGVLAKDTAGDEIRDETDDNDVTDIPHIKFSSRRRGMCIAAVAAAAGSQLNNACTQQKSTAT